jgi:type IV secretion system protein VirB9
MKHPLLYALLAATLIAPPAVAGTKPRDGAMDGRIKTFVYDEQEIYRVKGYYGYSTTLQFSPQEVIESISLGDSVAWQATPVTSHRNILMIKPLLKDAHSNMTVLTTKRIYSFELSAANSTVPWNENISYRLTFQYPDEQDETLANFAALHEPGYTNHANVTPHVAPDTWNFDYSVSGHHTLHPVRTFDNGTFTYFQFADTETTPAIFVVDDRGEESLVNFTRQGKYIVVERLGRQFSLRDGPDIVACIFNEGFPERSEHDALSPGLTNDPPNKVTYPPLPEPKPGHLN